MPVDAVHGALHAVIECHTFWSAASKLSKVIVCPWATVGIFPFAVRSPLPYSKLPIGIVVSSGPPHATVPDVSGISVDDATARLDGSFESDVVEEGSETVAAGTVLRQSPEPGSSAVLGSTVTLTVARAPEWRALWSQGGNGPYDSGAIQVTVPQGKWRIVVDLSRRYLIFGSGSATVSWEGTGAGHITLDSVGSDEVAPLSGAGTYRLHVHPQGSVSWDVRIEQFN